MQAISVYTGFYDETSCRYRRAGTGDGSCRTGYDDDQGYGERRSAARYISAKTARGGSPRLVGRRASRRSRRSMALRFVVDTSVIKRLAHPAVRRVVEPLAAAGELARARITDLEVGYSARNELEWDRLVAALAAFELVESTASHHRRALQVQRLLAQRSQRGRKIPDLLIAAAGEDRGLAVLHYDADFDLIAAVTGQPCQWVVPGGSID